jgi:hypothetical protein
MARIRWAVPCQARRKNGEPCSQWSRRGGFTCHWHLGSTLQNLGMAAERLPKAKLLDRDVPNWRDEPKKWHYLLTPGRSWPRPRPQEVPPWLS